MYDVVVVGAGHAGIEACLAASRMNKKTAIVTLSKDMIGSMPCNPSVGGPAKGIVVREIDALGGMMPVAADKTALQFKMLNTTKGPGVWSLRVQSDKIAYKRFMKNALENQANLDVIEAACKRVVIKDGKAIGVELEDGTFIESKTVVLTAGTYMTSNVLRGHTSTVSGPEEQRTVNTLSQSLRDAGIKTFRLKTGTPARIKMDTIDFSKSEPQPGTNQFLRFSETTKPEDVLPFEKQKICHLIYTQPETHEIIHSHLHDSAMYSGLVKGVGPRYCPSIEDKLVRFADKDRHQLFLEPESNELDTIYIQGFSTSMPIDVQEKMVHSLPGLENCVIEKYAYAIEYDAIDPLQMKTNMENKIVENLFTAGQVNGTSGYEEAAGQGLMAGANAALKVDGREPFVLRRDEAYIGVMLDDLCTKGTKEPYRLLTSRAEYRLLLRQDNADLRLTEKGYEVGLISKERYDYVCKKKELIDKEIERVSHVNIGARADVQEILKKYNSIELSNGTTLEELIRRPELDYDKLAPIDPDRPKLSDDTREQINILIKYAGYISRQIKQVSHFKKLEKKLLPTDFDYNTISGLRIEAQQKLNEFQPLSIGQASRISGVTPADISVLLVFLEQLKYSNPDLFSRLNPDNTSVEQ